MVKFIIGKSGSGKTKWLIDEANADLKNGHENIVFIDTDDSHIFTLDHSIRLINARDFRIDTNEKFYGFLLSAFRNAGRQLAGSQRSETTISL